MADYIKNIIIEEVNNQVTIDDIKKVEKELSVSFPEDYKKHILKYNGGHPVKNSYPIIEIYDFDRYGWGKSTIYDCEIAWFYAINNEDYDIVKENKFFEDRIPNNFIAIGEGSGGDLICISIREKDYGKVYFWGHDWDIGPNFVSHVLIANSFADFINSLYETELLEDENGKNLWVHKHDRYSLPACTEIKKYGNIINEFFDKTPKEVEEFIIKRFDANGDLLLLFQSGGKEYFRRINKVGNLLEEGSNSIHTKNPIENKENNHEEKGSER